MNTLRGIIKRVLRRKGRVGRTWSMKSDVARSVNRLSLRPPAATDATSRCTTTGLM